MSAEAWPKPSVKAALGDTAHAPHEEPSGELTATVLAEYAAQLATAGADGSDFSQGLGRVEERLQNCDSNACVCLVCLEVIHGEDPVWICREGCHDLFHLHCIQGWARQQKQVAAESATRHLNPERFPDALSTRKESAEWGCPKCRTPDSSTHIPTSYYCFCGKTLDPTFDPWLPAHSCGEKCGRELLGRGGHACGHSCMLLCHPGPCPPCPRLVEESCHCGKVTRRQRCGQKSFSCGTVCGKGLSCGHNCPAACHPDSCPPCELTGEFSCKCGKERRTVSCSEQVFECGEVCGKPLACGRHKCSKICHYGDCGGCPMSGIRHCHCGKVEFPELTCMDAAPSCGDTCGRWLPCGRHRCTDRCHPGDCAQACRQRVTKACRCGRSQKEVTCHETYTCSHKCTNLRDCGNHQCKKRCCDGNCPPCQETCDRKLRCGNHRCQATCHRGSCLPCPLTVLVSCACGRTNYTLPCGSEKYARPPRCRQACLVPVTCRHADTSIPHGCHFGPCPPCKQPCGSSLPCGHTCGAEVCHDATPVPVDDFTPPAPRRGQSKSAKGKGALTGPPAQRAAEETSLMMAGCSSSDAQQCPPCCQPVTVSCLGGHTEQTVQCHAAQDFSCGQPCGRVLQCGKHHCQKECHRAGPETCGSCSLACDGVCHSGHACPLPCHAGDCPPCEEPLRLACHCGKTTVELPCHGHLLATEAGTLGQRLCCEKPCHKQLPLCGHPCRSSCHEGNCQGTATCREVVTVFCRCKSKRESWTCGGVQEALGARGLHPGYSEASKPRLLDCDDSCLQRRRKDRHEGRSNEGREGGAEAAEFPMEGLSKRALPREGRDAAGRSQTRKLTREERRIAAEKREAEKKRRAMYSRIWRRFLKSLPVVLGLILGFILFRLLAGSS